jgi:hypothetical protein
VTFTLPSNVIGYGVFRQSVLGRPDQAVAVRRLRFGGSAFTSIPTMAPSAAVAPLVSSFKSGKYLGPGTLLSGKTLVTVAGPGVAGNGATELSRWFRSQYSRRSSDVHSGHAGDVSRAAGNLVSSGQYVGPSTILAGKAILMANGPGASDNGTTESTLSTASGADGCTFPSSATSYAGPIANSPYAMQLQNAGITSTALSYGVASSPNCSLGGVNGDGWRLDTLIGVSQDGNTITIFSFSDGADHSTPVDEITYASSVGNSHCGRASSGAANWKSEARSPIRQFGSVAFFWLLASGFCLPLSALS